MSSGGATVFFTAPVSGESPAVAEVFARVDNGLPPDAQHDLDLRAFEEEGLLRVRYRSQRFGQCDLPVGLCPKRSKVFFTTRQPLPEAMDSSENPHEYTLQGPEESGGKELCGYRRATQLCPIQLLVSNASCMSSPDGSRIYFTASGVLTRTPNSLGQEAEAGKSNMYLYERDAEYPGGRTVFCFALRRRHCRSRSSDRRWRQFFAGWSLCGLFKSDAAPHNRRFRRSVPQGVR